MVERNNFTCRFNFATMAMKPTLFLWQFSEFGLCERRKRGFASQCSTDKSFCFFIFVSLHLYTLLYIYTMNDSVSILVAVFLILVALRWMLGIFLSLICPLLVINCNSRRRKKSKRTGPKTHYSHNTSF